MKMAINFLELKLYVFCNERKLHSNPILTIYNSKIPIVTQFLGVRFDNKINNFKAHIDFVCQKCDEAMNYTPLTNHLFVLEWNMVDLPHVLIRQVLT